MKPIRQQEGRKAAGKFQGEPTYQGLMPHAVTLMQYLHLLNYECMMACCSG